MYLKYFKHFPLKYAHTVSVMCNRQLSFSAPCRSLYHGGHRAYRQRESGNPFGSLTLRPAY